MLSSVSSHLLPSMNSAWWRRTISMKTTPPSWFMSMMWTTTPLFSTGLPMRRKSRRKMIEICPKGCSRLIAHKSGVSLKAFSRVLSALFLPLFCPSSFFLLYCFVCLLICMFCFVFSLIWRSWPWMEWTKLKPGLLFVFEMWTICLPSFCKTPTMLWFLRNQFTDLDRSSR